MVSERAPPVGLEGIGRLVEEDQVRLVRDGGEERGRPCDRSAVCGERSRQPGLVGCLCRPRKAKEQEAIRNVTVPPLDDYVLLSVLLTPCERVF